MQFSMLKFAVAALAVYSDTVLGQMTAAQIVDNLKVLTKMSQDTNAFVSGITVVNFSLQAPQVPNKLQAIVSKMSNDVQEMAAKMDPVEAGGPSDEIASAFRDFSKVSQAMHNTLIGKHGLITLVPFFGPPVAASLVAEEKVFDSLAFALVPAVPSRKDDINKEASALSTVLSSCQQTYNPSNSIINVKTKRSTTLRSPRAAFRESLHV